MASRPRQAPVNTGPGAPQPIFTGQVLENIVAGVIGLALVAYLVYALVDPDRF